MFDCVEKKIVFQLDNLRIFDSENSPLDYQYVNPGLWGPRGKKSALTVEPKNFSMLAETLFGKENSKQGSMMQAMRDFDRKLVETELFHALEDIFHTLSSQREQLDVADLKKRMNLPSDQAIVMFFARVRSDSVNDGKVCRLSDLKGYAEFFLKRFGETDNVRPGLDYITGRRSEKVTLAGFAGRYNIHKIFQTTTLNYASGFSDFSVNFSADPKSTAALDKASSYILKNWQPKIAGISHIVVPSFLNRDIDDFEIRDVDLFIKRSSELLFNTHELDTAIQQDLAGIRPFWVNYIGYESDGNSFKVISHIKDVNSVHLRNVIDTFNITQRDFFEHIGGRYAFNLQAVYRLIPLREEKKNEVLALFKMILEQRSVNEHWLLQHFIQLILCHWYGRQKGFTNINAYDSFDFAVKDAVFKYSALIYALRKLKLIPMEPNEEKKIETAEKEPSAFLQRMETFFEKMRYGEQEKALFFLGRVLSTVAYAQYKKGYESKPVLNKLNFNGMDVQAITRFSLDLSEKTVQYGIHQNTEWDFARFRNSFNPRNWNLTPMQNVFFLLVGYSFNLIQTENPKK